MGIKAPYPPLALITPSVPMTDWKCMQYDLGLPLSVCALQVLQAVPETLLSQATHVACCAVLKQSEALLVTTARCMVKSRRTEFLSLTKDGIDRQCRP